MNYYFLGNNANFGFEIEILPKYFNAIFDRLKYDVNDSDPILKLEISQANFIAGILGLDKSMIFAVKDTEYYLERFNPQD